MACFTLTCKTVKYFRVSRKLGGFFIAGHSSATIIASTGHLIPPPPQMWLPVVPRSLRLNLRNTAAFMTPSLSLNLVQKPGEGGRVKSRQPRPVDHRCSDVTLINLTQRLRTLGHSLGPLGRTCSFPAGGDDIACINFLC